MATYRPEDIDFAETAPITIEAVDVIDGSRQEVWDVLLDYPGWTSWFPSISACAPTSDPATGVGSTRQVKLKGGAVIDERFIAWEEPAVWAFTGTSGPPIFASLVERVTLRELSPDRTQITYRMALRPRTGLGPLMKLSRGSVRKNLAAALRGLDGAVAAKRGA